MTPEDIAEIERHDEEVAKEFRELERERDRAKRIVNALGRELRDAVAARGQAERERDEARAALDRVRKVHAPELVQGELWCPEDNERHPCTTWRAGGWSGT